MAQIGTAIPELSVGGSEASGGNRRRRRHYGRGRGGRSDQATIDASIVGQESQQQQQQPQQQQQSSGRQRGRPRGPYGEVMAPNLQNGSAEPQSQFSQSEQPSTGPWASRQRNRRGRGGGNGSATNDSGSQNRQSQQLNWQQQLLFDYSQQQPHRGQAGSSRGGRGGGRGGGGQQHGRDRGEPQEASTTPTPAPGNDRVTRGRITVPRGFGARLTVPEPTASPAASGNLHHETSSFELEAFVHNEGVNSNIVDHSDTENWGGDQMEPAPNFQPSRKAQAQPAATVKEAEDLMTRIHKGIASGNYECMICYGGVTRKSPIWDCGRCYAVFHLKCIQKWAKQGLDAPLPPNALENGDDRRKTWRCPGCQNLDSELPSIYECWCGKAPNPEAQRYIAPHSCGQPCGKERASPRACPHPCNLQCHAGPCPPCTAMGPAQACFCGRESTQRRCLDTDYQSGWSCQQICGDYMPCGEHTCPRPCHSGLCGDCGFEEELRCYCGKQSGDVKCCDKGVPLNSIQEVEGDTQQWTGYWSCKTDCERYVHSPHSESFPITN